MVTRYYICDNCNYTFVTEQPMHESLKKKCPKCHKYQLYQDLSGQHCFVYQEPKTLGHLGDRNRERMGKYELEAKEHDHAKAKRLKPKKTSWYNSEGKDLSKELAHLDTPEKTKRYVLEGK